MLYLRAELLNKAGKSPKSSGDGKPKTKAGAGTPGDVSGGRGEQRGGDYVARIQVGYEKDGSPKYRYFRTEEAYEEYLKGRGRSKASQELEDKVKREHEESTDKHSGTVVHQPASKIKPGLLGAARKSLPLYVRI